MTEKSILTVDRSMYTPNSRVFVDGKRIHIKDYICPCFKETLWFKIKRFFYFSLLRKIPDYEIVVFM